MEQIWSDADTHRSGRPLWRPGSPKANVSNTDYSAGVSSSFPVATGGDRYGSSVLAVASAFQLVVDPSVGFLLHIEVMAAGAFSIDESLRIAGAAPGLADGLAGLPGAD